MASKTAARHSCDSPEWFTPPAYIEAARKVLGVIELDPASHSEANRIVRARRFYDERANGLRRPWSGRVFINPPGGLVAEFWHRLIDAWEARQISAAIWIGYSLEQLQTLQGYEVRSPLAFPICVPDRRIAFVESEARTVARLAEGRKRATSPSHANYVTYLGRAPHRFARVFGQFGQVRL